MPNDLERFQMRNRYQMTFYMGSGESGAAFAEVLMAQSQRLKRDSTKTLRIALLLLAKTKANDQKLIDAIAQEPE